MTRISESVFSRHRGESNEWLLFYNNSGAIIPAGAMMEIDGVDADGVFKTKKPTGDDLENVLVNGDVDVPVAGYGQGWEEGTHPVVFDGAAPAAADRIGSQNASWNAKKSDTGTHLVRAVSGSTAFAYPFSGAGVDNTIAFGDYVYGSEDNPTTRYGYPNQAIAQFIEASGGIFVGAIKFASRVPATDWGSSAAVLATVSGLDHWEYLANNPIVSALITMTLGIYKINEDFDPSVMNYNAINALDTTLVDSWVGILSGTIAGHWEGNGDIVAIGNWSNAYGLKITISVSSSEPGDSGFFTLDKNVSRKGGVVNFDI